MDNDNIEKTLQKQEEQIRNLKLAIIRLESYIRLLEQKIVNTSIKTRQNTNDINAIRRIK